MVRALGLCAAFLACSAPPASAPPSVSPAKPAKPPPQDADVCTNARNFHRETLPHGTESEIARGVKATYRGSQHDQFDNGDTALLLDLEIGGEPWLPDARDHATHAFGSHCVRIVSSGDTEIVLDVALQPEHEYEASRCAISCCRAGQARAPDGTEECCFCSDAPQR